MILQRRYGYGIKQINWLSEPGKYTFVDIWVTSPHSSFLLALLFSILSRISSRFVPPKDNPYYLQPGEVEDPIEFVCKDHPFQFIEPKIYGFVLWNNKSFVWTHPRYSFFLFSVIQYLNWTSYYCSFFIHWLESRQNINEYDDIL